MDKIYRALQSKYEFIILDCPILLVSDSFHFNKIQDLLLYVIKSRITDVEYVRNVE